ncbi:MAG: hypothetical protein H0V21_01150 [Rubrobacter sp.]|nr:hypothetical protein [Rubrobacter sp.]
MARDRLLERISIEPQVSFGKPCVRGQRVCFPTFVIGEEMFWEDDRLVKTPWNVTEYTPVLV